MSDIRHNLNHRRRELLQSFEGDAKWVRDGAAPSSERYERSRRNIDELREIEATLATMQLADAQIKVAEAQFEVANSQRALSEAADRARSASEDATFWGRRFLTTISLGNAAGLSAVLLAMGQSDAPSVNPRLLLWVIIAFGAGAFIGGTVPLLRLAIFSERWRGARGLLKVLANWIYPILATLFFLVGTGLLIDISLVSYVERQSIQASGE